MDLIVDSNEKDRIKSATKYYEKQKVNVRVEKLEIGDYLFDNKVVFEFKTVEDFVSSIQDNRVFNQSIDMAENYDHRFVIIQGTESDRAKALAMSKHYQQVSVFQYLGAIASINRYCTVIESYSPFIDEAYYRMLINAKKCLQNKPIVKRFSKKDKNPCFNWLTYCNYGINYKKANDIVSRLDLNTLEDLFNLTIEDLTSVKGIGEKTAEKIIQNIKGATK